ncbi:aldehyde dehydrogenase family protein [Ancylobacter moscoviensis]
MNARDFAGARHYLASGTIPGLPDRHFIDGGWVPPAAGNRMESFDPGRAAPFASFAAGRAEDVDLAVEAASRAMRGRWRDMAPPERGRLLVRVAELIRERVARLALVECVDSGKTLGEAAGDVETAARYFDYYGGAADKLQGDYFPLGRDTMSFSLREPVGVTAHIVPWNYPISTFSRSVAPALAAGCTAVVKPAETTPLSALMMAELIAEAGAPPGVCNVVTGTGPQAGAPLSGHPGIHHVTFTGSVATGVGVMQAAAPNIASVTLELGGKSPLIALADCDLDAAVEGALWAIFANAGQICSAGSRLVVERAIHGAFLERLVARAQALRVGHGLRANDFGAVNSDLHLARIAAHVEGARARGREILTGGRTLLDAEEGNGWFYAPTIIDALPADDPCVQEEIFGPVLAVQVVEDAEQALAAANGTRYGLMAGIYTRDITRALRLARDIDAGQVTINEYWAGGICVPFGGTRASGFGREKGLEGLSAYLRTKSIVARV